MKPKSDPYANEARVEDRRPVFFKYITAIVRVWAILTLAVLWFCTVELITRRNDKSGFVPWYILAVSILATFFEILWILNLSACCSNDGQCCCLCWRGLMWIDTWKKYFLYTILSIPCFLRGLDPGLYAILAGLSLIILACFYLMKAFKYCECITRRREVMVSAHPQNFGPDYQSVRDNTEEPAADLGPPPPARRPAPNAPPSYEESSSPPK